VIAPRQINDPQPGRWMIKCCRHCPPIAARVFWCSHEPGFPDNPVDQPYLQGQIGLELVPPADVWQRRGHPISEAEFNHQVAWLRWAERNAPTDPRLNYRAPVAIEAIPIPRWSGP